MIKCENGPCINEATVYFIDMTRPIEYNLCDDHYKAQRQLYDDFDLMYMTSKPRER